MDTSKVCFGCFGEHDGKGPCPHCGFDLLTAKHPYVALPIGTILNGRYLTGRVLGVGGFGVTYLAFDMTLEISVAVKEFLPSGIALRDSDHYTMTVSSPDEQTKFDSGASKFLEEARLLAKLRDVPNIVTVHDYFRENNTAYFVMEYIEGVDLMKYTQQKGGKLSFQETLRLLLPIIESLDHVHAHNLLHRDISPDNIVVMKNGSTRLLDFGAARLAIDTEKSKSIILKHGFAPEEQYRKHGNQGPWSDEYALAATMYLILTGVMPPDAIERVHEDTMVPPIQLGVQMPQYASDAIMKALSVNASGRFADMKSFGAALSGTASSAPAAPVSMYPASANTAASAASSSGVPTEPLPTASTGFGNEQMVGGKTVAMDQSNTAPSYTPQKVLSPSVLANGGRAPMPQGRVPVQQPQMQAPQMRGPQVQVPQWQIPQAQIAKPQKVKKSIWKRPLTYIVAGLIALAGIGTAVGVYIVKNYEWGEETTTAKPTTTETEAPTLPDPKISYQQDQVLYEDETRLFSLSAPNEFVLTNDNGLFCLEDSAKSLYIYTDVISGYEDIRLDDLTDFVAQSEKVLPAYMSGRLGLTDIELYPDYLYTHVFNDACVLEYSGSVNKGGKRLDATILAAERKEDKGIFLYFGFMPVDDYGMYSQEDCEIISDIMMSVREKTSHPSSYVFFEQEDKPSFIYDTTSISSVTDGKLGNSATLELVTLNTTDSDSKIFILPLGSQSSITTACTATEQALGSAYKFGGYTSVTPTINTSLEMRIRNYTLSKIDDGSKTLNCTACVINLNGNYYCVAAICGDKADLERITLDFTMTVKTMLAM